MSALTAWLDRHTGRSPAVLGERARAHALAAERRAGSPADSRSIPAVLADGAHHALACALAQRGDRSTALDLLAGDALITLALLARAEEAPQELGAFARALLASERSA